MENKKTILVLAAIFAILFSFASVSALGVTRPTPYNIEVVPGTSAEFSFEIQGITSEEDLVCNPSVSGLDGIEVSLDNEVPVSAGEITEVVGELVVPEGVSFGEYSGELSVRCSSADAVEGSSVKTNIGGLKITANVVETLEEGDAIEEKEASSTIWVWSIAIIIVAGLAVLLYKAQFWKKLKR